MGSWSVYCGISNITIASGDKCVLLPIKENTSHEGYLPYLPATLPIFGTYDDYGGLENIEEDDNTKLIETHFGVNIHGFCQYFTRGQIQPTDEEIPQEMHNIKELSGWKFMYINREVYDFMSTYVHDEYGEHNLGNEGLLKKLGAKYLGEFKNKDKRYKHFWDLNGLELKSDGDWVNTVKEDKLVYSHDPKEYIEVLSEDKIKILKSAPETLWKIYGNKYASEHLYWVIGVRSHYYSTMEMMEGMSDRGKDKFSSGNLFSSYTGINYSYINKIDNFGDKIAQLSIIRKNMYSFSQYFNPYVLYLTPQCGEYQHHQKIIEKFSEINKSNNNYYED